MSFDISKKVEFNTQASAPQQTVKSAEAAPIVVPVGERAKLTVQELADKLGISVAQLSDILIKHIDFNTLSFEDQKKIVDKLPADKNQSVSPETQKVLDAANKDAKKITENRFNNNEFSKISGKGNKLKVYLEETAKNEFLYNQNPPKTIEDWNALSEKERVQLYEKAKSDYKADESNNRKGLISNKDQKTILEEKMTRLQTANSLEMSLEEFEKLSNDEKQDAIYGHLKTNALLDNATNKNTMTALETNLYEENNLLIETAKFWANNRGEGDIEFCPSDAKKYLEKLKKEENLNGLDAEFQYLKAKSSKGDELTQKEKERLHCLEDFTGSEVWKSVQDSFGTRKEESPKLIKDISNSEYSAAFNNAKTPAEKVIVMKSYLEKTYGNDKDYAKIIESYIKDSAECGQLELTFGIHEFAAHNKKTANNLVNSNDTVIQAVVANQINEYDNENVERAANKWEKLENEDLKRGLHLTAQQNAVYGQELSLAKVQSKSTSQAAQNGVTDMAVRIGDANSQTQITAMIAKNSTETAKVYNASQVHRYKKEAQIPSAQILADLKNEKVTTELSEHTAQMHVDNQVKYEKLIHKASYDFSDEVAKNIQTNLANDIQNCDKNNQLEMHKDIMTSKYEQVLEQASKNIHNYDESVQYKALETTYQTGNQKAIAAAESQILQCAPKVQVDAVKLIAANNLSLEVKEKLDNGQQLSVRELAELTPAQRQEYFKKVFEKASPSEKIQMLSNLSGSQQKTVYTIICRFIPDMLSSMVESGKAVKMLGAGLPLDANNKIISLMKRSTKIEVINQLKELKLDKNFKTYFNDDQSQIAKNTPKSDGFNLFANTFATPPFIAKADETKIYEQQQKKQMDIRI